MNLDELRQLCEERHLLGHWYPDEREQSGLKPYLWKSQDLLPGLMRAGELVDMSSVAMRMIQPRHPDMPWGMSKTIHCTLQCLMPGERTRGHRNVGSETRFVIKGAPGAHFIINGEAFPIEEGDFVTTPTWAWHDHYNAGTEPAVWLDGMENRLVTLGGSPGEQVPGGHQEVTKPPDFTLRTLGHMRPTWIKSELPTPPYRYRWSDTYAGLMALKEARSEGDPCDGIYLRYSHPLTGGPTLPTRTFGMHLFTPGMQTTPRRRNCTTIYYAFRGAGIIDAEGERLAWGEGDLMVLPPWVEHAHENDGSEDSLLFSISDQPAIEALGLYCEEIEK